MKQTFISLLMLFVTTTAVWANVASQAYGVDSTQTAKITSASLNYTFNGRDSVVTFPASRFRTLDFTGTVAENFKIESISVQTDGEIRDVYAVVAEYKDSTRQEDVEINYVPLTLNGNGVWSFSLGDNGWLVKNNNRSTGYRNFRIYFVANKDSGAPIYYDNYGSHYIIRFYTKSSGGGGGEGSDITFYERNTATLSLKMSGGASDNVTYTFNGDGTRDIWDNPGEINSLNISGFTLRLQRTSTNIEIGSVSVQYKVFEEGSDGQWKTLNYTFQENEDSILLNKKYTGTSATQNLAAGLTTGKTYILQVKYQVIDKNGKYYFFTPSSWYGDFRFSVKAEPGPDSTSVAINAINFPDANFRSWLLQQSYGSDGILTQTEIENIERIVLMSQNIRNLKGIEFFTQIELLNCVGNLIDSLDVSKNTALTNIQCSENNLKSLDVSNNTLLETLSCNNNQLTSLYLSRNTALQSLQCNNNKLTSLNVSSNTALTYLDCYSNQINGAAMDSLVGGLPVITSGSMWDGQMCVIYNQNEGNDMTVAQVSAAKAKGWTPKYYVSREEGWQEYAGSGPATLKCAQPVINYEDGKVTFSCETEDVEFHYNCYAIYRANGEGDEIEVSQQQYIIIDVYASKEGYEDSETKSAVISVGGAVGKKGDVNMDGIVNGTDIQEVINIIVNEE